MRTEYSGRYIVLGLKIAYYRKNRIHARSICGEKLELLGASGRPRYNQSFSLKTLFKIADVLGIPPVILLEDD